jgi:hypothetical protein
MRRAGIEPSPPAVWTHLLLRCGDPFPSRSGAASAPERRGVSPPVVIACTGDLTVRRSGEAITATRYHYQSLPSGFPSSGWQA